MMSASLRELRRERWSAQADTASTTASAISVAHAAQPSLALLLRVAIAELLSPRRPAHD